MSKIVVKRFAAGQKTMKGVQMRSGWIAIIVGLFLAGGVDAAEAKKLKTKKDKVSYSIGLDIGKNFKNQAMDIDTEVFIQGLRDALSDKKALLTDEEVREVLSNFQKEMREKQQARMRELNEKNKKDGEAFLAANKKKKGVVVLPSGLQYKVIKTGKGPKPKASDTVTTHYRGTLIDGTEFDSSHKGGEPVSFPVSGVIAGWTEALQLMEVGAKWELAVPADLAYGPRGAGPMIGPNATLVFEVELISIK